MLKKQVMDISQNMPDIPYVPSSSPVLVQSVSPPYLIPLPSTDFQNSSPMPSPSHGLQTISPVYESSPSQELQNSSPLHGTSPSHEMDHSHSLHSPSPHSFRNISPVSVPQMPSSADFQTVSPPSNISYHSENPYSGAYQEDISYITLKGYNPVSQGAMSLNIIHPNTNSANVPVATAAYAPAYQPSNINYFDNTDIYGRQNENVLMNRDEGIGSSPSSLDSTSPPIVKEEPFQSLESSTFNSGPIHGYFYSDSGVALTRNIANSFPAYSVQPNQQCVRCGGSSSRHDMWFPDSTGTLLCYYCASQPVTDVPRGIPSAPEVERQQRPLQRRRRQAGMTKRADLKCHNCRTEVTTLWRRTPEGNAVCNSCGLYQRVNHKPRPVSMRKDVIQRRKRKPRSASKKPIPDDAQSPVPEANNQVTSVAGMQPASPSIAAENPVRLPSLNINMILN